MSRNHDWRTDGRDGSKSGGYYLCSGCQKRVFFLDGWTDFEKLLTVGAAWIDDISCLSESGLASRTVPGSYGIVKGYHGVLGEDCDEAQRFAAEFVMVSLSTGNRSPASGRPRLGLFPHPRPA